MEIHFQQKPEAAVPMSKTAKFKGRSRSKSKSNNKYVGVRQRPSGRWVAEIKDTTQKIRMWLGTFETAEEAARAYDEAACLLRGSNTRTNFVTHHVSPDSPLASRIRNLLSNRKKAKQSEQDSRATTNSSISTPTPSNSSCLTSSSSRNRTSSPTCSGNNSVDSLSPFCEKIQDSNLFDDAYKPDLSSCSDDFDMGCSQSGISWGLDQAYFDHRFPFTQDQLLDLPKNIVGLSETGDMEFSEFERMKVERQISASLYAMNGVQEYMETVCDPIEALWDLPPLCSLLC